MLLPEYSQATTRKKPSPKFITRRLKETYRTNRDLPKQENNE